MNACGWRRRPRLGAKTRTLLSEQVALAVRLGFVPIEVVPVLSELPRVVGAASMDPTAERRTMLLAFFPSSTQRAFNPRIGAFTGRSQSAVRRAHDQAGVPRRNPRRGSSCRASVSAWLDSSRLALPSRSARGSASHDAAGVRLSRRSVQKPVGTADCSFPRIKAASPQRNRRAR